MEYGSTGRPRHKLRLARSEPIAVGVQSFELRAEDGASLPPFTPGAHLNVRTPNGSFRNYSICNDPSERDRYVIAVKREVGGRGGSVSMIDDCRPGALIDVGTPENLFPLDLTAPQYVFVAGGIGITPILSMMRHLIATAKKGFRLYYLTRSAEGTAFRDEIRSMTGPERSIVIHHDNGDPGEGYELWPVFERPSSAHIYCCGPRPLMDSVRDMTGHWPSHAVHFEDFGSDQVRPRPSDVPFTVRLDGSDFEVPVGSTILETLRRNGIEVPSSCESGTCGTCRTKLLNGDVDHRDLVLDEQERASHIMICVSRGRGTVEIGR